MIKLSVPQIKVLCKARGLNIGTFEGRLVVFRDKTDMEVIESIYRACIVRRLNRVVLIAGDDLKDFGLYDFLRSAESEINSFFFGVTKPA